MNGWRSPKSDLQWADDWSDSGLDGFGSSGPSSLKKGHSNPRINPPTLGMNHRPGYKAFIGADELPSVSPATLVATSSSAEDDLRRLQEERDELEREIEDRKSQWEREWEELEQEREEAQQKLVSFQKGLESERAAFYANLEREKKEFEEMKRAQKEKLDKECAVQQREWREHLSIEQAGLQRAKVEWHEEYCKQQAQLDSEKEAFKKEIETTYSKMRGKLMAEKDAFYAKMMTEVEAEKKEVNRQRQQLEKEYQERYSAFDKASKSHTIKVAKQQRTHLVDLESAVRTQFQTMEKAAWRLICEVAAHQRGVLVNAEKGKRELRLLTHKSIEKASMRYESTLMGLEEKSSTHMELMKAAEQHWELELQGKHKMHENAMQKLAKQLRRSHIEVTAQHREILAMYEVEMTQLLSAKHCETTERNMQLSQSEAELLARHIQMQTDVQRQQEQLALKVLEAEEAERAAELRAEEKQQLASLRSNFVTVLLGLQQQFLAEKTRQLEVEAAKTQAGHAEAMQKLEELVRGKMAVLSQLEEDAAVKVKHLEAEFEERRRNFQLQEAKEREAKYQEALNEQRKVLSACDEARAELQQLRDRHAKEDADHQREMEFRREQREQEQKAQERRENIRKLAEEERRRMDEQRTQRMELEIKLLREREEENWKARCEAARRELADQLALAEQQCRLFAVAFWEKGCAVGAEEGEWNQILHMESQWHPVKGQKWLQDRTDRITRKEESQRERLALRERDMRQELFDQMREERREVEMMIRERRARNTKRVTALARIRGKGAAADMARDNMPNWSLSPTKLPPLADVASLLHNTNRCDAAEMAAYKSYFTLQMREMLKPIDPCTLPTPH